MSKLATVSVYTVVLYVHLHTVLQYHVQRCLYL